MSYDNDSSDMHRQPARKGGAERVPVSARCSRSGNHDSSSTGVANQPPNHVLSGADLGEFDGPHAIG